MAPRKISRTLLILTALLAIATPALLAQPLVTIRASSLDAVLSDMETLSAAIGSPLTRAQALEPVQQLLRLETLDGIDFDRPVVIVLPAEGMLMQAQGLVGAIPVSDAAAMIAALRERFPDGAGEGLIQEFVVGEGMSLFVQPADAYLMVAANRQIAEDAVLADLLTSEGLPPGSLGIKIQLEPVMPMIQMGLMQGRQALAAQIGEAGDASEEDTGAAEENPSSEEQRKAAAVMVPVTDAYFKTIADVLANISSISLSFERNGETLMMHDWVVPRAGSTFAELLAGQKGGWPAAAQVIAGKDAAVTGAANVTLTPRMRTAMAEFSKSYFESIGGISKLAAPGGTNLGWLTGISGSAGPLTDLALRCLRGDMGLAVNLDGEHGLSIERAVGLEAAPECAGLAGAWGKMLEGIDKKEAQELPIEFTADALEHRGVNASRISVRLTGKQSDAEATDAIKRLYGGDKLVAFDGISGDLQLTTAGHGAGEHFRTLVDRQAGGVKGDLDAGDFAPLNPAPGFAVRIDVPRLARGVQQLFGDEDAGRMKWLEPFIEAETLPVLYGVELNSSRSEFTVNVPMELLRIFGKIRQQEHQHNHPGAPAAETQAITPDAQDG